MHIRFTITRYHHDSQKKKKTIDHDECLVPCQSLSSAKLSDDQQHLRHRVKRAIPVPAW